RCHGSGSAGRRAGGPGPRSWCGHQGSAVFAGRVAPRGVAGAEPVARRRRVLHRSGRRARPPAPPSDDPRTLVVPAAAGMAGIGKTALVVLAAHRLTEAGRYPDGTLFVDLHGYSGRIPTDPADALETLLRGLGVPGPQIPSDFDARVGLYRSVLAQRRVRIRVRHIPGMA